MCEYRITTISEGRRTLWAYGTINSANCTAMLEVIQFILDSCSRVEDYYIMICAEGGKAPSVSAPLTTIIAIYGMYKRDFHERLENKPTWTKHTFDLLEVSIWE